ncbi:sensor domain-containing protein [Algibacillus agarilyticus]|uniref:sensor domain-containing protein n=1 Tax=Algibacillus agarilyticus TaxID=2234133 RepID=UPI000DD0121F|nr:GGDEF domain-containing protein [Algibacillus agarilyticus]
MTEHIISANLSSTQSRIRGDLTSFLLTTIDQQGGFYVLYDAKGEALLHSINLPTEVTTDIKKLFARSKSERTFNSPAHRHLSSEAHGYNISLNEVYFKDEMHLLLIGFPEEKRVNELYNAFPVGVLKVDYEWNLKYCNVHCPNLLGLGEDELHGKQWLSAFDQQSLHKIFEHFSQKKAPHETHDNFRLIVEIVTPLGRKRTLSLAVDEQLDLRGHQISYYILIQDITSEYNESAYLKYLAHHDTLTQLKNRSSLLDAMEALHEKDKVEDSALLFIDLDKFKYINDHYGHSVGDEVLKIVARRLESATRDSDIVARLGGDEFVIILTRVSNEITAYKRASNIVDALNQPALINDQDIMINTSIGLTMGSSVLKKN